MKILKKAGAFLLSVMLVMTNTTLVPLVSAAVAGTTETLSDGTIVHHIDISSKYDMDTIGSAGDTVSFKAQGNSTTTKVWWGYNYGWSYGPGITGRGSGSKGTLENGIPGYPAGASFFEKDADGNNTGDIIMKKIAWDENKKNPYESDETFTFKTFINSKDGFKGGKLDAKLIDHQSHGQSDQTFTLNQVRTSSIKLLVSSATTMDWSNTSVRVYYTDGTYETNSRVWTTNIYPDSSVADYEPTDLISQYTYKGTDSKDTAGMRPFARRVENFKAVLPKAVTDDAGTTTYVLQETENEIANVGFRGFEVDVDPTKIVSKVSISKVNDRTQKYERSVVVYAIAQVEANVVIDNMLSRVNNAQNASDLATVLTELGNEEWIDDTTYSLFSTADKEAVAQALIDAKPENGYTSYDDLKAAYTDAIVAGIVSYASSATAENIDEVMTNLSGWSVLDLTVFQTLSEGVRADVKAIMISDKQTAPYTSVEDVQNAFSQAMTKAGINLANSAASENVVSVITELGTLGVLDASDFLLLDDNAKAVTGAAFLTFFEEESVFTENSEIVAVYNNALTKGIISYVNSVNAETAGAVITNIGAMDGVLAGSGIGFEKYAALSDEAKTQINEKFVSIISAGAAADYTGIAAAFDEAMNLSYITTVVTPGNYAAVHRQITKGNYGYGSYHDNSIGKNASSGTHLQTYINKWEMKDFRGYNYMNLYSKALLTEFYLPLKDAVTDISMNYNVAYEQNDNHTGFYVYTAPVKFDLDTSPAVYQGSYGDVASDTNEQFVNWYNFLNDTTWTTVASKVQTGWTDIDITANALTPFKESDSDYLMVRAGGSSTSIYDGWRLTNVPKMKLIYDASAILTYINNTAVTGAEKIDALGASGVLSGSNYGYDGYKGLTAEAQKAVTDEIDSIVSNGGYASYVEFIESYNKIIEKQLGNIIDSPEVHITFDDETESNTGSKTDITPEITGTKSFVTGPDGSKALSISNTFGETAQNYLNVGKYSFGEDSFAVTFWMRAVDAGVGETGHNPTGSNSCSGNMVDFTANSYSLGGVALSNKDFSANGNNGFAFSVMPASLDFGVNLKIGESEACNTVGIQSAVESRWHQIAFVVDRNGYATTYVDNKAVSTFKVSEATGTIDGGEAANLIFGADGLGQYGMISGEFDDIRIYSIPLSASVIEEMYYEKMLNKVNYEAEVILGDENASSIYPQADKTALSSQLTASKEYADGYEMGSLNELKEKYNSFNNYYDNFLNKGASGSALLMSDIHISESDYSSGKGLWMVKSLNQHEELGIDLKTWVNAGDYAETGNPHQPKFFNILDANVPEGVNVMVARGNHDEPANGSRTVVNEDGSTSKISLSRAELQKEYIERMNRYFDSESEINSLVSDENGNLVKPYYYSTDGLAHYLVVDNYQGATREITDEQFVWMEKVLDEVTADGKPVFITMHLPITDTCAGSSSGNYHLKPAFGAKLTELLNSYENSNIFLINGHTHNGFGAGGKTRAKWGSFWQLNMPSMGKGGSKGYAGTGTAYYANFYEDRVVFRARNFTTDEWLRDYDITIMLNKPAAVQTVVLSKTDVTVNNVPENCSLIVAGYNGNDLIDAAYVSASNGTKTFEELDIDITGATLIKAMLWNVMTPACPSVSVDMTE